MTSTFAPNAVINAYATPPTIVNKDQSWLRDTFDYIFGESYQNKDYLLPTYDETNKHTMSLPELLVGQARTNLGERLFMRLLLADSFYFTLAPIRETFQGSLSVEWDTITFNAFQPQPTPEQGRVRLTSWQFDARRDVLQRLGMGAQFDYGFFLHPRGRMIAQGCYDSLNNGAVEGMKFGVIHALLRAGTKTHARQMDELRQTWNSMRIEQIMERERRFFGIVQRDDKAIETLDAIVGEEQAAYGGRGDTWLVHWKCAFYQTVSNELKTSYQLGGPDAARTLKEGPNAFTSIGGSKVYVVRAYDVSTQNGPADPLKMERFYGGYHLAFDHIRDKKLYRQGYSSRWRSIQLINGDTDSYSTVHLHEMLQASGRIDPATDEMVGIDDPHHMQFRDGASRADPSDREDSFHYRDPRTNQLVPCRYFGQVNSQYFSTVDRLNLARTILWSNDSLGRCYDDCRLNDAIRTVRAGFKEMELTARAGDLDEWASALAIQNAAGAGGETHPGTVGCPPLVEGLRDWVPNQFGCLDLPDFSRAPLSEPAVFRGNAAAIADTARSYGVTSADQLGLETLGDQRRSVRGVPGLEVTRTADNEFLLSYSRQSALRGRFSLPPFFASAGGLRTIRSAVQANNNKLDFESTYPLNFDACKRLADSVQPLEEMAEGLARVLPVCPGLDPNYASSYLHGNVDTFSVFIENLLWVPRVPVWLYKGPFYAPSAQAGPGPVPSRSGGQNDTTVSRRQFEEAVRGLFDISTQVERLLDQGVLGRLSTSGDAVVRHEGQQRVDVMRIGARLSNPNIEAADAPTSVLIFDPVQPSSSVPVKGRVDLANMPEFARAALADVQFALAGQEAAIYDENKMDEVIARLPDNAAGRAKREVMEAYKLLVRLRHNFSARVPNSITQANAEAFIASETVRGMILTLLSLVTLTPGKAGSTEAEKQAPVARRFISLIDGLLIARLHVPVRESVLRDGHVDPISVTSVAAVRSELDAFLSAEQREGVPRDRAVFGTKTPQRILGELNAPEQRAAQTRETLAEMARQGASLPGLDAFGTDRNRVEARVMSRIDPSQYMRAPLFASPEQFEALYGYITSQRGPNRTISAFLLSDPTNVDVTCGEMQMARHVQALRAYRQVQNESTRAALPGALVPIAHLSNTRGVTYASQIAAALNVGVLRDGRARTATSTGMDMGQAMAIEAAAERARLNETYGMFQGDEGPARRSAMGNRRGAGSSHVVDDPMLVDAPAMPAGAVSRDARSRLSPGLRDCMDAGLDNALNTPLFQQNWDETEGYSLSDPAAVIAAKAFMLTRTRGQCWRSLIDNDVIFPASFIGARPFIHLEGVIFIKTLAGQDTAITWTARPVTSWGDNAQTQTYTLTVTYYAKTIVHGEKNVYLVPMAMITGYRGGMNVVPFDQVSFMQRAKSRRPGHQSILWLMEPYSVTQLDALINLTGAHQYAQFGIPDDPLKNKARQYTNADWAAAFWGLRHFNREAHRNEATAMTTSTGNADWMNLYCFQEQTLYWHPTENAFTNKRRALGYFPDERMGPGVVRVWKEARATYPKPEELGVSRFHAI